MTVATRLSAAAAEDVRTGDDSSRGFAERRRRC